MKSDTGQIAERLCEGKASLDCQVLTEHIDYRKGISAEWIGARKSFKYYLNQFSFHNF